MHAAMDGGVCCLPACPPACKDCARRPGPNLFLPAFFVCRYAYGACCVRPSNCYNALCKMDTHTGEVK